MSDANNVIAVTPPVVQGMRIEKTYSTVWGLVVRSRGLGGNVVTGLRSLAGGEIKECIEMLSSPPRRPPAGPTQYLACGPIHRS